MSASSRSRAASAVGPSETAERSTTTRASSAISDSGCTCPPSTTIVCPVMYPASSVARNSAAKPMSSTLPSRFCGIEASIFSRYSGPSSASPSVSMLPGITALIVMPLPASSIAAVRRNPSWAALVAP